MQKMFQTKGVCARQIVFNIEGDVIQSVKFEGGCEGNAVGLSRLVAGMRVEDAAQKLAGIRCGRRDTSCPDQLSVALNAFIKER